MATIKQIQDLIKENSKESSKEEGNIFLEALKDVPKKAAQDVRTIAGSLLGGVPDLTLIPSQIKAGYQLKEGPKTYTSKIREMIDELTGGYTKPQEGIGQSILETGSELVGGLGPVSKVLGTGAKLAAKGTGKIAQAFSKGLKKGAEVNKLTPENIAAGLGGLAGSQLSSEALHKISPIENEENVSILRRLANIIVPFVGGSAGGAAGMKGEKLASLTPKQKVSIKAAKKSESIPKLNKWLDIDKSNLSKDTKLGIEGTLGTYSNRPFLKMIEYQQRKNPVTDKFYKNIEDQNINRYKKLLGMSEPEFEFLGADVGGNLLKKGTEKRKGSQEKAFNQLYEQLENRVPIESVIPKELIQQGKVGQHFFKELSQLTPSEQKAVLSNRKVTDYLERLGKTAEDLNPASPLEKAIQHGLIKENHPITQSLATYSPADQLEVLKELGIKLPKRFETGFSLEKSLGPTQYHSLESIKKEAQAASRPHYGQITDKNIGGLKELTGQLENVSNSYLKEHFPDLYQEKKAIDKAYSQFKKKEVPIINKLLGGEGTKEITPVESFRTMMMNLEKKPSYLTLAQKELTQPEKYQLTQSIIKNKARKNLAGETTATSFAQSFAKMDPKTKSTLLKTMPESVQKLFPSAVESILEKKGLERLENNSGTFHHTELNSKLGRAGKALFNAAKFNLQPLLQFLGGEIIFPKKMVQNILTNQNFLKNLNRFNHAENYSKSIEYGKKLMENNSFKNALKYSTQRSAFNKPFSSIKQGEQPATIEDIQKLIQSSD